MPRTAVMDGSWWSGRSAVCSLLELGGFWSAAGKPIDRGEQLRNRHGFSHDDPAPRGLVGLPDLIRPSADVERAARAVLRRRLANEVGTVSVREPEVHDEDLCVPLDGVHLLHGLLAAVGAHDAISTAGEHLGVDLTDALVVVDDEHRDRRRSGFGHYALSLDARSSFPQCSTRS